MYTEYFIQALIYLLEELWIYLNNIYTKVFYTTN